MAQKRMFSKKITDSAQFQSMPLSSQALYFHLNLHADDDGIIDSVRQIARHIGANEDDIKVLFAKHFLLEVDGEIVVIRDWWVHNTLLKDRYVESLYKEQLNTIYSVGKDKTYTLNDNKMLTECYQNVAPSETATVENRVEENSIDKSSIDINIKNNNIDFCDIQPSKNIYTEPSSDDDIKTDKVAEALLKYIPNANTIWLEKINIYKSKNLSDELIIKAIENTALANTRDCRYFMAICDEYIAKGYKSAAEVDEAKKSYKNKKSGQGMSRDAYNDWFKKNILANV